MINKLSHFPLVPSTTATLAFSPLVEPCFFLLQCLAHTAPLPGMLIPSSSLSFDSSFRSQCSVASSGKALCLPL